MACSFLWLISLIFLSLGISEVYCSWYRSHWRPRLATTNTEWISGDSYDTWNSAANQAITFLTRDVLCRCSRWTLGAL
jgi:hypothetical protein